RYLNVVLRTAIPAIFADYKEARQALDSALPYSDFINLNFALGDNENSYSKTRHIAAFAEALYDYSVAHQFRTPDRHLPEADRQLGNKGLIITMRNATFEE